MKRRERADHNPEEKLRRIYSKCIRVGECLEWQGAYFKKYGARGDSYWQYPEIYFKGKTWRGNRLVLTLKNGPIPKGLFACHSCDNPKCLNTDHLYLGTPLQNVADMTKRGRSKIGSTHPTKSKTGYRGVHKVKRGYQCIISARGERKVIYGFATAEAAARHYDKLSKELHGEHGIRNFKD